MEAVLQVKPPHSWIKTLTAKFPAKIRILDCKALEGTQGVQELFEITAPEEMLDELVETLKTDSYVYDVDVIRARRDRITGAVKTRKCTACRAFATSNCFLISAVTKENGMIEWVVFGGGDGLPSLVRELESKGVDVTVSRISKLQDARALTDRQEQILQIAFEKGYFDVPKGIRLRGLAKLLSITPATLTEILRRGQKRVLMEHFKGRTSTLSRQQRVGIQV